MELPSMKGDIGVIGLAVMGQNLILNMNDHGFQRLVRRVVDDFLADVSRAVGACVFKILSK